MNGCVSLDGVAVEPCQTLVCKGMMNSAVPNLASTFGQTNASQTLKAKLAARCQCRLLNDMDRHGHTMCTRQRDPSVGTEPCLDFSAGCVQRAWPMLPRQGDRKPWQPYRNHVPDWLMLRLGKVDDGVMAFGRGRRGHPLPPPEFEVEHAQARPGRISWARLLMRVLGIDMQH